MPATRHPALGGGLHPGHDRRQRRHRPAAQVVAVGEAAGQDNQVEAVGQSGVAVPDHVHVRAGRPLDRHLAVAVAVGAGEDDHGGLHWGGSGSSVQDGRGEARRGNRRPRRGRHAPSGWSSGRRRRRVGQAAGRDPPQHIGLGRGPNHRGPRGRSRCGLSGRRRRRGPRRSPRPHDWRRIRGRRPGGISESKPSRRAPDEPGEASARALMRSRAPEFGASAGVGRGRPGGDVELGEVEAGHRPLFPGLQPVQIGH